MLHPFSIFPATGPAAVLDFGQKKKAHTMATTAAGACPNDKCCFRQCKILVGHKKKPCACPTCTKLLHLTSYNGLQMMLTGVPKLGGDLVACSKKCAVAAASKRKKWRRHLAILGS
jgi:hypothetical protein